MQPLYFGESGRQLLGVYHAAQGAAPRDTGVVLCYPLGHEYIRSHRAFRNLASQLSRQAYHTLRFDYFGQGDSAGEGDEVGIQQCLEDIETAIEELKDTAGVRRISLIGLRLGATFAALVSRKRADIETLVLWDPVPEGPRYVRETLDLRQAWIETRPWIRRDGDGQELIGFPLTASLRREFDALKFDLTGARARRIAMLFSDERFDDGGWRDRVAPVTVETKVVATQSDWDRPDSVHVALLAHPMVQEIARLLA